MAFAPNCKIQLRSSDYRVRYKILFFENWQLGVIFLVLLFMIEPFVYFILSIWLSILRCIGCIQNPKCHQNTVHAHCLKITQNVAIEWFDFPSIFVLLKLTCLVTLFDRKLQVFKNSPKWTIFVIFNELLSTQNKYKRSSLRSQC